VVGVKGQVQQRGVERRQAILSAAIEVFARNGFRGSAINDIGARAGISGTGVLHHFGSKAGLLFAVIQERDRLAEVGFRDLADAGGLEMLRGLIRYARKGLEEPGLNALHSVLLVEGLGSDSITHDYFVARMGQVTRLLAEGLAQGQAAGEIRHDVDVDATAVAARRAPIDCRSVHDVSRRTDYQHLRLTLTCRAIECDGVPP